MPYTAEQIVQLESGFDEHCRALEDGRLALMGAGLRMPAGRARDFHFQGVCRRLKLILRSAWAIFEIFPPDRSSVLDEDERLDVGVYLHAFLMNVYGVLDNIAWVYVETAGGVPAAVASRIKVGMGLPETRRLLPPDLVEFFESDEGIAWFTRHAKDFRDALAHRIPPYIPPFTVRIEDADRFQALEKQINDALAAGDAESEIALSAELDRLKLPSYDYLHEIVDNRANKPILHAQIVFDISMLSSIVQRYLRQPPRGL